MKITDFKVFIVANPPPSYGGKYWIFIKLTTNSGITGIGEAYSIPFHPKVVKLMIEDVCERYAIGQNPFQIEKIWRQIYSAGYTQKPDSALAAIISGIEIALWDIIGKETNKPIHQLIGGQIHQKLRTYTYLYPDKNDKKCVYQDPETAAKRANQYANEGFTAVKFDPVGPYSAFDPRQLSLETLNHTEKFVKYIRQAVGNQCDILFGTHGQMTPAAAVRLAKKIEKYDPLWFEEPTPPEMPEEMAHVAKKTSIPIATGERLATKYEFARVIQHNAAAILQPAIGKVGGILEAKKIAAMAETKYIQIAPHLYCGPIEGAANIHLAATIPNFLILESIRKWDGFHAQILKKPILWENGYVHIPKTPGLGVELNEKIAEENPYNGKELHLEMENYPL